MIFQPVAVPSADWLLDFLDENAIDAVVVRPGTRPAGWQLFLWFDVCKRLHPDQFQRIMESQGCATYEFRKTERTKDEAPTAKETRKGE